MPPKEIVISKEQINFNKLMDMQEPIFKKYENLEILCNPALLSDETNLRSFTARLDQYYMSLEEEIYEAIIAFEIFNDESKSPFYNTDNGNNLVEELCDVILYASTIASIARLKHNASNSFQIFMKTNNDPFLGFNKWLTEVVKRIGKSRRIFPERKWHRPVETASDSDVNMNLHSIIHEMAEISIITAGFSYQVFNICNGRLKDPNDVILNKSRLIYDLPLIK